MQDSVEKLYAFHGNKSVGDGWQLYNVAKEFKRQGLGTLTRTWRFSSVNADYAVCDRCAFTL